MFSEPDATTWIEAELPNYVTNIDLMFPYSDVEFMFDDSIERQIVKIPVSLNDMIQHVDYWGEGRVVTEKGIISGFPNSYNINHGYKLVSSGPDKDKRIPNRIPVYGSYANCDPSHYYDTIRYIKNNSVLTVTVVGSRITPNCIRDIVRIVNEQYGKVIVYGVHEHSPEILELCYKLKEEKAILLSKDFILPSELQGLTYDSHVAFLGVNALTDRQVCGTNWMFADAPNYSTNIDLLFPYSDMDHFHRHDNLQLVKIPVSPKYLIQHVDYFGEGRVASAEGISGFPNSYNVNHQYQLVSSGPDRDKRIPNRIGLTHFGDDTSKYIKDDSVLTVTVEGERITSSCAKDIARIVNNDQGKVVVYGVQNDSPKVGDHLTAELKKKELFLSEVYALPSELQGLTCFDSHVAFLNKKNLGELTYSHVVNGNYDSAVKMSSNVGEAITEIVNKLISSAPRNVMIYAYKLWHDADGDKDVVRNHFKQPFQYLMDGKPVTIVNKHYGMALKIHLNTEHAQGVSKSDIVGDGTGLQKTDSKLSWRCHPTCYKENLTFTLCNVDSDLFIRMDFNVDKTGDRSCWGAKMFPGGDETGVGAGNYMYHLEPLIGADGDLVFIITNVRYKQGLKLFIGTNANGDRLLCGHDGNIHNVEHNRFRWVVTGV